MIESKRSELIDNLVHYGLTPIQAQVYLTLLKLGISTAKSISRTSDLHRVDVYRALRHLRKFGIVEEKLGNPSQFISIEPNQALRILLETKRRVIEDLHSMENVFSKQLFEFAAEDRIGLPTDNDENHGEMFIKVIWGEQQYRRLEKIIGSSKREVLTVFSPVVMRMLDQTRIPELVMGRLVEGVEIRSLTTIIPENLDQAIRYSKIVNLRHIALPPSQLRYTIVDDRELILPVGVPPRSSSEGTVLWSNANVLISALKRDFNQLWENASPANKAIEELSL